MQQLAQLSVGVVGVEGAVITAQIANPHILCIVEVAVVSRRNKPVGRIVLETGGLAVQGGRDHVAVRIVGNRHPVKGGKAVVGAIAEGAVFRAAGDVARRVIGIGFPGLSLVAEVNCPPDSDFALTIISIPYFIFCGNVGEKKNRPEKSGRF